MGNKVKGPMSKSGHKENTYLLAQAKCMKSVVLKTEFQKRPLAVMTSNTDITLISK